MSQLRSEGGRMQLYVGVIWIGDMPGRRVSVWAENPHMAKEQVEAEHGKGHVLTLANEEDAERPR